MGRSPVRSRENFLVFGAPVIEEAEIREVIDSLKKRWLGTGPKVARFEEAFRRYKKAPYAIAVNSGTAALHLSLLAAGIGAGDEVITTALTFCGTVNAVIHAGATPVLVDVDPATMNLDPLQIESRITSRTRALLPVHFGGRPCDMEKICRLAEKHRLILIEDCAHAIESEYRGTPAGRFGDYGCFSFYATKNVTTGEGGMVLTNREGDASTIKTLALHGMTKDAWNRFRDEGYTHYAVVTCGFKYNMMDLQAAIGIHQLRRVESNWKRRQKIWRRYQRAFREWPLTLPPDPEPDTRHSYHLYPILVDAEKTGIDRDAFLKAMTGEKIGVGVHYLSLAEHPYYQNTFGWKANDYPHAMAMGRQTVSLPLTAGMKDEDVEDVINAVGRCLNRGKQEPHGKSLRSEA